MSFTKIRVQLKNTVKILDKLLSIISDNKDEPAKLALQVGILIFDLTGSLLSDLPLIISDINKYKELSSLEKQEAIIKIICEELDFALLILNNNYKILEDTDLDEKILETLKDKIRDFVIKYSQLGKDGIIKLKNIALLRCCF